MVQLRLDEKRRTHVAIMRRSWGLIEKIIAGKKTVESRWYKNRCRPWDQITPGDTIYFKDSAGPVRVKARVTKVLQFENLTPRKTKEIIDKYGEKDLGFMGKVPDEIQDYINGKNYCLLVFFDSVQKVKPFFIDKSGFGMQAAWLVVEDMKRIKSGKV